MDNPKFPDEIQQRITDEFLITLKDELENVFVEGKPDNPTYWNYYQWHDTTCGFYTALKIACELHNFMELYDYLKNLEWYDSDILDSSLTEMLYKRGLIKEGTYAELYYYHTNIFKRLYYRFLLFIYNLRHKNNTN